MDPDLGRYPVVWAAAGTPTAVFPVSPATLRTLANATVAPMAEERPPSTPALESSSPRRDDDRAASRGGRLPGRDPGPLPLGRQRRRSGGVRPVRERRPADRSRPDRVAQPTSGCAGRSSGSRPRPARGPPGWRPPLFDDPAALLWDAEGLLVVKYGFTTYGFEARTGELRWTHRSGTPLAGRPRLVAPAPRHRPGRGRDVRDRAGRRGRLAGRPFGRRGRGRARRRSARPDQLRRPADGARPADREGRRRPDCGRAVDKPRRSRPFRG